MREKKFWNLLSAKLIVALSVFLFVQGVAAKVSLQSSWSIKKEPAAAIDEAIASLNKKDVKNPQLVVAYFTEQFDPQQVSLKVSQAFPKTKIYGQTVYMAVFTDEGLHFGRNGSIALMSFEGSELSVGIAGAEIESTTDVSALAMSLGKSAVEQAGKKVGDEPSVVLVGAKKGSEEQVLKGLSLVFEKSVSLVGGTPSTNSFGGGAVIANDQVYRHGTVVGTIYSTHKAGSAFYSGFEDSRKSGKVTDAKGRLLITIDNKPAQEVYKKWGEGKFDHLLSKTEDLATMETAVAPLAKRIQTKDGQKHLVTIRPQKFMANGSLTMGGDVSVGETLYYVEGTKDSLVKHAGVVTEKAIVSGAIAASDLAGGLQIYCAGASTVIGLRDGGSAPEMVAEIKKAMNGKPFIGGFSSAEQGQIRGLGFFNSNLMSSMVVFSN